MAIAGSQRQPVLAICLSGLMALDCKPGGAICTVCSAQPVLGVNITLLGGFFVPVQCAPLVHANPAAGRVGLTQIELRPSRPLLRSWTIQFDCTSFVPVYSRAVPIGVTQVDQGYRQTLLRSLLKPLYGHPGISLHPQSFGIGSSKLILGLSRPPIG